MTKHQKTQDWLARFVAFAGSLLVMGIWLFQGGGAGSSIRLPSKTVPPVFFTRKKKKNHRAASDNFSSNLSLSPSLSRSPVTWSGLFIITHRGPGAGLVRKWDDPWLTAQTLCSRCSVFTAQKNLFFILLRTVNKEAAVSVSVSITTHKKCVLCS